MLTSHIYHFSWISWVELAGLICLDVDAASWKQQGQCLGCSASLTMDCYFCTTSFWPAVATAVFKVSFGSICSLRPNFHHVIQTIVNHLFFQWSIQAMLIQGVRHCYKLTYCPIWKFLGCGNLVWYKIATRLKTPWISNPFYIEDAVHSIRTS